MKSISELMKIGVPVIRSEATVREAAIEMKRLNVGALPVCQEEFVLGMLTDRDIILRVTARGKDPDKTLVSEVMTDRVVSCNEQDDLDEVLQLMNDQKVGRVIVYSENGRLKGMLSLGDILEDLGSSNWVDVVHSSRHHDSPVRRESSPHH